MNSPVDRAYLIQEHITENIQDILDSNEEIEIVTKNKKITISGSFIFVLTEIMSIYIDTVNNSRVNK